MNFFSWKTTDKIFMYLLAPFILQNFEKILRDDPKLWGCATFGPKMAHLSWTKSFWFKPLSLLSSTSWPFSLCKIQKNSYSRSRVMRMHIFWPKMVHLPQTHFVLENYHHSHLPVSHFHCKIFKKNSSSGSRVIRMCNFWIQNGPFPQMRFFSENLLMNLVSFIHAYLHAKNQSLILIYWWNIDG